MTGPERFDRCLLAYAKPFRTKATTAIPIPNSNIVELPSGTEGTEPLLEENEKVPFNPWAVNIH